MHGTQPRERRTSFVVTALAIGVAVAGAGIAFGSGGRPLSARDRESLEEKAGLEAFAQQVQQQARLHPPSVPPPTRPPAETSPNPPPPEGIVDVGPPLPPEQYLIQNGWQQLVDDHLVQAFAGALAGDPSQGVVVVVTRAWDLQTMQPDLVDEEVSVETFPSPLRLGSLRVVSAQGSVLGLVSDQGIVLAFDVTARRFVPTKP
jgi:hypothetical protein